MLKNVFNSQLKKAAAFLAPTSYKVALSGAGSFSFVSNFKPYDVKPDEPILEPEEQPNYYNVYDDDEFPGESTPKAEHIDVPKKPAKEAPKKTKLPPSKDPNPLNQETL